MHELKAYRCTSWTRKGSGTRLQITNTHWVIQKTREFQKNTSTSSLTTLKPLTVWVTTNWKIFKETGIPGHPASWETWVQIKKQQLELYREQQTSSKLGKEYVKAVHCHPAYLTYMQTTSCEMPDWMNHKLGCPGAVPITSDMPWHHPNGRKHRGTNEPLSEGERGELKSQLKTQHSKSKDHGIWPHHSMANGWGNNGKSGILYFGGSKITADGDCSHEIKRHLLLGRKAMTNVDSILKSTDIIFPTKVHIVKAMVFPAVIPRCESWTVMKAEHWRSDAFKLWCWRRLLRLTWTVRRSNQISDVLKF